MRYVTTVAIWTLLAVDYSEGGSVITRPSQLTRKHENYKTKEENALAYVVSQSRGMVETFITGAALISVKHALTLAEFFNYIEINENITLKVVAGGEACFLTGARYKVSKMQFEHKRTALNVAALSFDFAVLTLEQPIADTKGYEISLLHLEEHELPQKIAPGDLNSYFAVGWDKIRKRSTNSPKDIEMEKEWIYAKFDDPNSAIDKNYHGGFMLLKEKLVGIAYTEYYLGKTVHEIKFRKIYGNFKKIAEMQKE